MIKTKKDKEKEIKKEISEKKLEIENQLKKYINDKDLIEKEIKEILTNDDILIDLRNKKKEIKSKSKTALKEKEEYIEQEKERIEILINELNKELLEIKNKIEELKKNKNELKNIIEEKEIEKTIQEKTETSESVIIKIQKQMIKNYNVEIKSHILNNSNNIITNIIHMADIHIRLSERHDIYQIIFNRLYEDLEEYKKLKPNTIILICGDLLHVKDKLDPDTTIFVWDFLKKLSSIFPTILIAGNHDCKQYSDKIDTITAILKDRPLSNIYYILNSGVYIYNNLIFGLSSIKDGYILTSDELNIILDNINYNKQDIKKICLYHGQINVATTLNASYKPNKESKSLNNFGEYDYYLLGDIHKFQYLNNIKTAAYPGSLISQSFGETNDYHGYLLWDIITGDSEYKIIKNEYAYYDIFIEEIIENDKISNKLIKEKIDYRKYGQIRVFVDEQISVSYKQEIFNKIKEQYKDVSLIIQNISSKNNIINNSSISETIKINDKNNIEELIRCYITDNFVDKDLTENIINDIINLLFKIQEETSENNIIYSKSDWKILWLSFDDMFIYGKGNIIEFMDDYMNNIVGIFGDNATGKSTLIDIITYMLFGRSARDPLDRYPKDLLNKCSKKAMGMIIIESNGKKYLIERICNLEKSKKNKHDVCVYDIITVTDNEINKKININGIEYYMKLKSIDIESANRYIKSIVGTYDNFISSSVLLQGNSKTFQLKNNEDRKIILYDILKINFPQEMKKIIKIEYEQLKKLYNQISENIFVHFNIKHNNKNIKDQILNVENNLLLLEKQKLNILQSETIILKQKYDDNDNLLKDKYILKDELYSNLYKSNEILDDKIKDKYLERLNIIDKERDNLNEKQKLLNNNLLKNKEKIIEEYDIYLLDTENILEEIRKLTEKKKLIKRSYDNYEEKLEDIINKLKDNKYKKISEIKIIFDDVNIIDEKNLLVIKEKELKELDLKIKNIQKEEIFINQTKIKQDYKELMENNLIIMDKTFEILDNKTKKKVSDHKEINNLIKQLSETINIILKRDKNHIFINKNNELEILLEKYYLYIDEEKEIKEYILEKKEFIKDIQDSNIKKEYLLLMEEKQDILDFKENIIIDREIKKLYDKNENNKEIINNYMKLQNELKNEIYYLNEIEKLIKEEKLLREKLEKYEEIKLQLENNILIKEKIENINIDIKDIQNKNKDINREINLNDKVIINMIEKIEKIEKKIKEYYEIKDDILRYEVLSKLMGLDGLQLYILQKSIDKLNTRINDILRNKFGIENELIINIDDKYNIDMGIKNIDNIKEELIETFSGMECVIVELCFKLAILEITEMPKSNMLFIDESVSVFDENRIKDINKLFDCIITHYTNVFLITHLNTVKNKMNHVLNITHYEGRSYINNTSKTILLERIKKKDENNI